MARLFGLGGTQTVDVFPVQKTEDEWKKLLDTQQYAVLRKHGTERAGTSPLNAEKRAGVFVCAGCDKDLFDAGTKFESGIS